MSGVCYKKDPKRYEDIDKRSYGQCIYVKELKTFRERFYGLMAYEIPRDMTFKMPFSKFVNKCKKVCRLGCKQENYYSNNLLPVMFDNCKSVHTFGMHHLIDIACLNKQNRVIYEERGVEPFRLIFVPHTQCIIERFSCNKNWVKNGEYIALIKNPSL